jgi:hypothetical protein
LILLTTYGTTINLPDLIEKHGLAAAIAQNLSRHAARVSAQSVAATTTDPMEEMALAETLKLLFNVTNFAKDHVSFFDPALKHIATILCNHALLQTTKTPLDPPFGLLINALLNLDLTTPTAQSALYPAAEPARIAGRLIQLLDLSMKAYTDSELDQAVSPLMCVLSAVYKHAPVASPGKGSGDGDGDARGFIRSKLLPTEEDRKSVLGKADTLPSRLLRNWSNPLAPQFRSAVAHLYFDMSDKNAAQFIENVGYGYASGFLFENHIPVPEEAMGQDGKASSSSGGGSGGDRGPKRPVNPITGQFLDEERVVDLPEMTAEEKEREAERLFVLFER